MPRDAAELAHRLAREAEAVCRHYLSNGRREGRYWLVGDVHNTPGRSMFVRLQESDGRAPPANGPMPRPASMAISSTSSAKAVACATSARSPRRQDAFLKLPRAEQQLAPKARSSASTGRIARSRKTAVCDLAVRSRGLWPRRICSVAEYAHVHHGGSLRFHPRCYYRPDDHLPTETWPAMIACVTDLDWSDHRRAPHLARSGRLRSRSARQSADRYATTGDGRSARQRGSLRRGG